MPFHIHTRKRGETKMETQTQEIEIENRCDGCLKDIGDNIFETANGDYICQDCYESENDRYYSMYHKN